MNKASFALEIAFKGDRSYLQSADVFDAIIARTGAFRKLRLTFKRLLSHQIEAVDAASCPNPESFPARFDGEGPHGAVNVLIRESDRAVTTRVPYDEAVVVRGSELKDSSIRSFSPAAGSLMERIVALNKRLIHETVRPNKKLLFTSASLSELLPNDAPLTIRLESQLGNRLFRSSIRSENSVLGEIVFYGA